MTSLHAGELNQIGVSVAGTGSRIRGEVSRTHVVGARTIGEDASATAVVLLAAAGKAVSVPVVPTDPGTVLWASVVAWAHGRLARDNVANDSPDAPALAYPRVPGEVIGVAIRPPTILSGMGEVGEPGTPRAGRLRVPRPGGPGIPAHPTRGARDSGPRGTATETPDGRIRGPGTSAA